MRCSVTLWPSSGVERAKVAFLYPIQYDFIRIEVIRRVVVYRHYHSSLGSA